MTPASLHDLRKFDEPVEWLMTKPPLPELLRVAPFNGNMSAINTIGTGQVVIELQGQPFVQAMPYMLVSFIIVSPCVRLHLYLTNMEPFAFNIL